MKGSKQIAQESGMSQQRVIQFARDNGVQQISRVYIFSDEDEKKFYERIGQSGHKNNSNK